MNPRRVTSWSVSALGGAPLTQIFVGDIIEAEGWASLVSGGAAYVLIGADGQRSEVSCEREVVPARREA